MTDSHVEDEILGVLYLLLVLLTGIQIGRIAYYRHKWRSFQVGFLIQLLIWAILRTAFFFFLDSLQSIPWLLLCVFWLPINIQFSTFSLLLVYFAHLLHRQKSEWKTFKRRHITVWAITNLTFLMFTIGWIIASLQDSSLYNSQLSTKVHACFSGIIFFTLSCFICWYGVRVAMLIKHTANNQTKLLAKVSIPRTLLVSWSLFFSFTSRAIFDFISSTDRNFQVDITSDEVKAIWLKVGAYLFWEIIPCGLGYLLISVRTTQLGHFSRKYPKRINNYANPVATGPASKLNESVRKYSAEDERTPFFNTNVTGFSPYNTSLPEHSINNDTV